MFFTIAFIIFAAASMFCFLILPYLIAEKENQRKRNEEKGYPNETKPKLSRSFDFVSHNSKRCKNKRQDYESSMYSESLS